MNETLFGMEAAVCGQRSMFRPDAPPCGLEPGHEGNHLPGYQPTLERPAAPILDADASVLARDAGIAKAESNAEAPWLEKAKVILITVAVKNETFTTDELWAEGLEPARENRALGAVMRWGSTKGFVEATDRYVPTRQKASHRAPIRVWKSKVYSGTAPTFDQVQKLLEMQ